MAWYNIYRPTKFEDVSGQSIVKSVLQNALLHNKVKHGYLLSGPKGTGKTTLARIFANNLNDLEHNPQASMDIIELDAASNSGVDNIRNLIESAKTAPFAGAYKVYIIDEVHMLSKSAMNALLKILEEPPEYLVFLLATTNPEKLLPTVLSRLTKLTLTSHTLQDIVDRLTFITQKEKMIIDKPSLELIAKRAGGGQRDAINILETLYSYGLDTYTIADTSSLLGLLPIELLSEIATVFVRQDFAAIKAMITKVEKAGLDGESFLGQLLGFLLEQSFEVNGEFDILIIPVAEILDLKLPINTIPASFALIQAKIKEKQFVPADQKKNSSVGQTTLESSNIQNIPKENSVNVTTKLKVNSNIGEVEVGNSPREGEGTARFPCDILPEGWQSKTDGVFISNDNKSLDINTKPEDNSEKQPLDAVLRDQALEPSSNTGIGSFDTLKTTSNLDTTTITPLQIQAIIHSFTKSPLCVMMFKILIPQIVVEKIQGNVITISLTAPTFVNQLENSKNQKLIIDHIFAQTNFVYLLELTTRSSNNIPLKDHRTEKEILDGKLQSEDQNNRYEAPKPSYGKKYEGPTRQTSQLQPKNNESEIVAKYGSKTNEQAANPQSNKPSTKPAEKYFYSVYQGLPDNTVGDQDQKSQVPVRLESIEIPIKASFLSDQNPNWASEVDELFDF
jgi:DNA polymerase III subunit gamma/tau